jgi:hypothetical protein
MALTRGGFRYYGYDLMVVLLTMTNAATEVAYAISSLPWTTWMDRLEQDRANRPDT